MSAQHDEEFELDIETPNAYLKQVSARIEHEKARTANWVAILLVSGVLVSLPLYLLAIWLTPDAADAIKNVFDKWFAIVSPLAGAAVGAYYVTRFDSTREVHRE